MKNPPVVNLPLHLDMANTFERAADILVKEGWRVGYVGEPGEPKCVLGAINMAICGNPHSMGPYNSNLLPTTRAKINEAIRVFQVAVGTVSICGWNNEQIDAQVVIDKLREIAQSLKN